MNHSNASTSAKKYTKGEKCICAHIITTITVILILIIIYVVHIFFVDHTKSTGVFETRRLEPETDYPAFDSFPIGLIYINITPVRHICNAMLLTPEWSLSAGHCVAMRSEPDLAYLLYAWRIKYLYNTEDITIKRSVIHPHFDRDTFANNVGLYQHRSVLGFQKYDIAAINFINEYYEEIANRDTAIISWMHDSFNTTDLTNKLLVRHVQYLSLENCTFYMSPIMEVRNYEFCVVLRKKTNAILGHGALAINSKKLTVLGTFSWGERREMFFPFVILNLSFFHEWIESITSLSQIKRNKQVRGVNNSNRSNATSAPD